MPKACQVASLGRILKGRSIEPDTVDLAALVDASLGYGENLRAVGEAIGLDLKALNLPTYMDRMEEARNEWAVGEAVLRYLAPEASPQGRQEAERNE
ncbi:MAG: hypothetical protein LN412_05480 [Candidatus Thermoplasmatota archaeon]|nr:hypothetical protein [Candidatus Thermoplasmatota archaeon]